MRRNAVIILALLAVAALGACNLAAPARTPQPRGSDAGGSAREKNRTVVSKTYRNNLKKYRGNADMLVLPGLLADRKAKRVLIQAEATGLGKGEIIEFFLIAEDSGHDYEALAVSFAKPSDVHKALVFIGTEPGKPVSEKNLRFWPKGERVLMTFACEDARSAIEAIRAEKLILDNRTGKPLPNAGLVFVGSFLVNSPEQPGQKVYAADIYDPKSIASNYNEPATMLDVPRQAPQSEVYGKECVNPQYQFPAGYLLNVVIEPEYKDGKKRVVSCQLSVVSCPTDQENREEKGLQDLRFEIMGEKLKLNEVLKKFVKMTEAGHDPFVTLRFGDDLTLKALHDLCVILSSIETEKGIRVEPPLPGHLYYKAFIPDEQFRDRANRISQPWEFHLSVKGSKISGTLTQIKQIWRDDQVQPELKITEYEVPTPEALRKELDQRGPGMPVILVFAHPATTHGQLMNFLRPVLSTHPTIHIFLEK